MKTISLTLCILIFRISIGQVTNGSFESAGNPDLTGWQQVCFMNSPSFSNNTPGGTGLWSLDMIAEHGSCGVTYHFTQGLNWLTTGFWNLSYWTKGHGALGPPATVKVAYLYNGSAPSLTSMWGEGNYTTQWEYKQEGFYWDGIFPSLDSLIVLIAAGDASGSLHSYFDNIQINSVVTDIKENQINKIAFRPNPAKETMWLDITENPTVIFSYNTSGQITFLHNFTHSGRTLQVDLTDVKSGINCLMLITRTGSYIVRFLKLD